MPLYCYRCYCCYIQNVNVPYQEFWAGIQQTVTKSVVVFAVVQRHNLKTTVTDSLYNWHYLR